MSQPRLEQGIRLVSRSTLARETGSFLVDRKAEGLTPGTVEFYAKKLAYLRDYLEWRGVSEVQNVTPSLLREYLLDLAQGLNPGGVHATFRAMRTLLRWYEREHEPQDWANPIRKVTAPRVPQQASDPVHLPDLRAMLATCERHAFAGDRDRSMLLALWQEGTQDAELIGQMWGPWPMQPAWILGHKRGCWGRTATSH